MGFMITMRYMYCIKNIMIDYIQTFQKTWVIS